MPSVDQENKRRPGQASYSKLNMAGQGGQGRAGQGRAGQGRAGQGRAGQGRAGGGPGHADQAGRTSQQDIKSSSVDLHTKGSEDSSLVA